MLQILCSYQVGTFRGCIAVGPLRHQVEELILEFHPFVDPIGNIVQHLGVLYSFTCLLLSALSGMDLLHESVYSPVFLWEFDRRS